jgi:tetratricopeptide (TPR) repeat protein
MNDYKDGESLERYYIELDSKLKVLTDKNPRLAIETARLLAHDQVLDKRNANALRAGALIDAGFLAHDVQAVEEGVALCRGLLNNHPAKQGIQYSLANGLAARADLIHYSGPSWYCETAKLRREARQLYRHAGTSNGNPHITTQALTNLGNSLIKAYRFIEAYDCYICALEHDPTNGVALTGAAKILLRFVKEGTGERAVLLGVAAKHLRTARENPARICELAGQRAYKELSALLETEIEGGALPDLSAATGYQRFVAQHRLTLAPTIEGLDLNTSRWDSLRIQSVTESINTEHGVPPIFAMFNVLKSDYLTARLLAYMASKGDLADSGKYFDTLDYATYGVRSSVLTLSQRLCLDVLDKIAVATSEYLGLPGKSESVYFRTRWLKRDKEKGLDWQPEVRNEIVNGNRAVIALAEVSYDIAEDGFLHEKKRLRNASTHRFAVLHDLGKKHIRECKSAIEHYDVEDFEIQLIETLQLTRAVLFYFVEMIRIREKRLGQDGILKVQLTVPDHDWIRGEDNIH